MAAHLIDEDAQRQDEEEVVESEDQASHIDEMEAEDSQTIVDDEIPEKYRGKSAEDLVRMHQESEKLLGRQSAEVGDLRKVVDTYIQTQLSQQSQQPAKEEIEDDVDFFSDPEAAVKRAIENHPKIKEAEQYTDQYRKSTALAQLQQKHPDMQQVLQDPKFGEWVQASKIRTQLYQLADQQFDYDAADELISLYKERKGVVQQTAAADKQARKQQVKKASTGGAVGSSEAPSRKVYRRSDIIKLMKTDPDRYQALSNEIMQAYAEGRVKS